MSEGLLYEPRSFWSIANVAGQAYDQTVRLDRRHFYNGGRYPIEIKRIAIAGINYLLTGAPATIDTVGWNESSSVVERVRVSISAPQRYYFSSRRAPLAAGMAPRPTAQIPVAAPASSMWGQCNLAFDKPLVLPRTGTIEMSLSAHTPWVWPAITPVVEAQQTQATIVWQEVGGYFAGSGRSLTVPLFAYTGNTTVADPAEKWPYPPDGYGVGAGPALPSPNWWPAQSSFPAGGQRGFSRFESTRSGSTELSELRTYIDQRDYDEALAAAFDGTPRPCPLSLRTGCRVRTVSGGSREYWWRPGAPLALVLDTITPAVVYELDEPFTMPPGEQLDLEVQIPGMTPTGDLAQPNYHIGVSLNGFAAIEG